MATMYNDQVSGTIYDIEQPLRSEDPAFVRRFHATQRAEMATAITVVVLLASGAVLLAVGLATLSWAAWFGGVGALLASVAVDERHKRVLWRSQGRRRARPSLLRRKLFDVGGRLLAGLDRRVPGPGWVWPAAPRREGRPGWDARVGPAFRLAEVTEVGAPQPGAHLLDQATRRDAHLVRPSRRAAPQNRQASGTLSQARPICARKVPLS